MCCFHTLCSLWTKSATERERESVCVCLFGSFLLSLFSDLFLSSLSSIFHSCTLLSSPHTHTYTHIDIKFTPSRRTTAAMVDCRVSQVFASPSFPLPLSLQCVYVCVCACVCLCAEPPPASFPCPLLAVPPPLLLLSSSQGHRRRPLFPLSLTLSRLSPRAPARLPSPGAHCSGGRIVRRGRGRGRCRGRVSHLRGQRWTGRHTETKMSL